jgi:hypothetical protein
MSIAPEMNLYGALVLTAGVYNFQRDIYGILSPEAEAYLAALLAAEEAAEEAALEAQ